MEYEGDEIDDWVSDDSWYGYNYDYPPSFEDAFELAESTDRMEEHLALFTDEEAKKHFYPFYQETVDKIREIAEKDIPIYRAIVVNNAKGYLSRLKKGSSKYPMRKDMPSVGLYWTWDLRQADPHGVDTEELVEGGKEVVILKAQFDAHDINVARSIVANINWEGVEKEIRMEKERVGTLNEFCEMDHHTKRLDCDKFKLKIKT